MSMDAVPGTYGALLLGAFFASGLSGVVSVQCIVYFKLYPKDKKILKCLVVSVCIFVWSAMWESLIANFGVKSKVDSIPRTIPLSVIFTVMSKMNWFLAAPIVFDSPLRLLMASVGKVSGAEMVTLETYTNFRTDFRWLFSVGLALSTAVDLLITLSLFMLLHRSRRQSMSLNLIIDSLILYALEIGSLTCGELYLLSTLQWLKLDNNLVFLGVHFVIGKLYANSLLAT
ncbi:hypothetical protein BJ165DRAFT_1398454 [Panaeolus papilionaceus]|nr:hypothetical protein BJ165DRAFT_1398454 [Panaeolus papilionaceus]